MDTTLLVRLVRPTALLAAAVGIPSDLYHFTIDSRAEVAGTFLFLAHGAGLVAALVLISVTLVGLGLRLGDRTGRAGLACLAIAYVGTLLVLGNVATEAFMMQLAPEELSSPSGYPLGVIIVSFALFAVGWFGVAVALGRHGLVPTAVTVVMCLGAVYGFTPIAGSYTVLLAGIAIAAVAVSRDRSRPAPARAP